ncbi:hypothetical protein SK128_011444, partial [Halocaridina rubra]
MFLASDLEHIQITFRCFSFYENVSTGINVGESGEPFSVTETNYGKVRPQRNLNSPLSISTLCAFGNEIEHVIFHCKHLSCKVLKQFHTSPGTKSQNVFQPPKPLAYSSKLELPPPGVSSKHPKTKLYQGEVAPVVTSARPKIPRMKHGCQQMHHHQPQRQQQHVSKDISIQQSA